MAFAAAGMSLAICDRDAASLEETARDATRRAPRSAGLSGGPLIAVLDVRESGSLRTFFSDVGRRFDHVDVLVNVVGGTFEAPFVGTDRRGWDALIRTNYLWLLDAVSSAAALMARDTASGVASGGSGGSIVNLTSIEAHRAAPGYAVYASLKAAVTHLSGSLAVELGPSGIRVNCIACDFVPTPGMDALTGAHGSPADASGQPDDALDAVTLPLGRKATPDDVANAALFLASELSSSITGTTLHPDGGALASSGWLRWPDEGWRARPPGRTVAPADEPRRR